MPKPSVVVLGGAVVLRGEAVSYEQGTHEAFRHTECFGLACILRGNTQQTGPRSAEQTFTGRGSAKERRGVSSQKGGGKHARTIMIQGYLAHTKPPPALGIVLP